MTEPPHETYEWLDAKQLGAWVRKHIFDRSENTDLSRDHPNLYRACHRWVTGESEAVSVWVVDRLLTPVDVHLWEIPDHIWRKTSCSTSNRRKGRKNNPARQALIKHYLGENLSHSEIARKVREAGFSCSDTRVVKRVAESM